MNNKDVLTWREFWKQHKRERIAHVSLGVQFMYFPDLRVFTIGKDSEYYYQVVPACWEVTDTERAELTP